MAPLNKNQRKKNIFDPLKIYFKKLVNLVQKCYERLPGGEHTPWIGELSFIPVLFQGI